MARRSSISFSSVHRVAGGLRLGRSVGVTPEERARRLPGDDLIPDAIDTLMHGITIRRPPRDVWPWLVQMGAGSRAGWYSYDWIDNGRRPSARRIVPEWQHPAIGSVFPATPGVTEGFTLLALEPGHALVLGWLLPEGRPLVTWTFVVDEVPPGVTRLLVRARGGAAYRFLGLPQRLSTRAIRLVHFMMQRRQLLGIAARTEAMNEHRRASARHWWWRKAGPVRTSQTSGRVAIRWLAAGAGVAAGVYAACAAGAWARYGHVATPGAVEADPLLDRFMPAYEIVERHHIRVAAPAATTFAAAREMDLLQGPIVRAIFRAREIALASAPDTEERPRQLLPLVQSLGWVVLAELPGREVVMGAVTRPWESNPTFRGIPPAAFAAFDEPGYVKIVWTLRADPDGPSHSVFRSETRAVATDAAARARFRRYWALTSPGIILIRWLMLTPLKAEAERRVRPAGTGR